MGWRIAGLRLLVDYLFYKAIEILDITTPSIQISVTDVHSLLSGSR